MQGRIVKIISNLYTVLIDGKRYECRARGKFRKDKISPLVGDFVVIDEKNNYILDILSRKNELKRPTIANVDKAMIVTSVKEPDISLNLLDKMLSVIEFNNITSVICLTKLDLLDENDMKKIDIIKSYYISIGYRVLLNTDIENLKEEIKNNVIVVTGQTGAGKSTLLNNLEKSLNLKTAPISKALGRGVHTTRHSELFEIASGLIADTPGFSSLTFDGMTIQNLKDSFIEFKKYDCEFKDCNHIDEENCGVKKGVFENKILESRYNNYLKFVREIKEQKPRWDS